MAALVVLRMMSALAAAMVVLVAAITLVPVVVLVATATRVAGRAVARSHGVLVRMAFAHMGTWDAKASGAVVRRRTIPVWRR
jgi:hypothetical protein